MKIVYKWGNETISAEKYLKKVEDNLQLALHLLHQHSTPEYETRQIEEAVCYINANRYE